MRDQFVEFFKFKPYITNKYPKVRFYRECTRGICIIWTWCNKIKSNHCKPYS